MCQTVPVLKGPKKELLLDVWWAGEKLIHSIWESPIETFKEVSMGSLKQFKTLTASILTAQSLKKNHPYNLWKGYKKDGFLLLLFQVYVTWMNFLINLLVPLIVMFVLNLSIYKELQKIWSPQANVRISPTAPTTRGPNLHQGNNGDGRKSVASISSASPCIKNGSNVGRGLSITYHDPDREARERDARYTKASILMVVVYFVCHTPRLFTNMAEIVYYGDQTPEVSLLIRLWHNLWQLSMNFIRGI